MAYDTLHFQLTHLNISLFTVHYAMQMATSQLIITTILVLCTITQAWTTKTALTSHASSFRRGPLNAKPSGSTPSASALHYQNGFDYDQESSLLLNTIHDELDTEVRLQIALQAARDADRRYGLCTPASISAWQIVDDIYSLSSASRKVEDNVKKCLGGEESVWSKFA